jgi:hypothetical protein
VVFGFGKLIGIFSRFFIIVPRRREKDGKKDGKKEKERHIV